MALKTSLLGGVLVLALGAALPAAALAADEVGEVAELSGAAMAYAADGSTRELDEDDTIYFGDRITTGADAALAIEFEDETTFNIGADGELVIDKFVYDPDKANGNSLELSVLSGGFRFVSGSVAKTGPDAMQVKTPVATIGIRGTTVTGEADATHGVYILLEEEDESPTAIQVANEAGSVIVDKPNYGTEVKGPGQAPTPPRRFEKATIDSFTRSFRALAPRLSVPRPRF